MKHLSINKVLTILFVFTLSINSAADHVRVLTSIYPPFSTGEGTGIFEQEVKAAFLDMNHSVEFVYLPRNRAIRDFENEKGQFYLGAYQHLNRDGYLAAQVGTYERGLFYDPKILSTQQDLSLEQLKGKTVGVTVDSSSKNILKNHLINTLEAGSIEKLFKLLSNKRVDAIHLPFDSALTKDFPKLSNRLKELNKIQLDINLIYLFSENTKECKVLMEKFLSSLNNTYKSGEYHRPYLKYYSADNIPDHIKPGSELVSFENK